MIKEDLDFPLRKLDHLSVIAVKWVEDVDNRAVYFEKRQQK